MWLQNIESIHSDADVKILTKININDIMEIIKTPFVVTLNLPY